MKISILHSHYLDYLEAIKKNSIIVSNNLSDIQNQELYNTKYNLTKFDIYKYFTAYDYINESLGCNKYTLTEGITSSKNKYNNILIDLFYHNISSKIMNGYPISIVFSIKQVGLDIQSLTRSDINYWRSYYDVEA
jgi:hypothetical protein